MMVETVWDPALDSTVELEVQAGKGVVRTRGKVRSVLPAIGDPNGPPVFAVGLEFVGLAPRTSARSRRWSKRSSSRRGATPLCPGALTAAARRRYLVSSHRGEC